jgi:hypothetical protein
VRRLTWRGSLYLACWAKTPYMAGLHPCHYLGFAYPDDDLALPSPAILAEIGLAEHTRITSRYLTDYQAAGLALRVAAHRAGRGSRLMAVVADAGIEFQVARIWPGATKAHETALKDLNNRRKLCPLCTPGTQAGTIIIPRRFRRSTRRLLEAAA